MLYDPMLFWPVANPINGIIRDLHLPLVAYGLDYSSRPIVRVLLLLVTVRVQVEYAWDGSPKQLIGALLVEMGWALVSCIVGLRIGSSYFFALHLSYDTLERTASFTRAIYFTYDGPVVEIVGHWRFWVLKLNIYALTCLAVYEPKATLTYLMRHAGEYDVVSAYFLASACILLVLWSFGLKRVPDALFRLRDWLGYWKDRGLILRLQYLRNCPRLVCSMADWYYEYETQVKGQERYRYATLEDGHIRLLRIKSKLNPMMFLETELISVSLEEAKEAGYEALSYTWQGQKPSHPILIDGKRIDITSNLHDLLLARRRCWPRVDRLVWADALCINQIDVEGEKPAQLLMMKDIYMNASRVIGWLGDVWNSSLAAEMIIDVDATTKIFDWNEMQFYDNWRWTKDGPHWQALLQAVCHEYFGRAWICQEIVLGQQFQFYLGGHYIPWHMFRNVAMNLTQPGTSSLLQQNATPASPTANYFMDNIVMISCLRDLGYAVQYPLGVLLSMFARLNAGKPRDKIYALLGLSNTALSQDITPNYTEGDQDLVFTDIAILLLRSKDDAATVLPHAGMGYPGSSEVLPSWVPDWSKQTGKQNGSFARHLPTDTLLSDPEFLASIGQSFQLGRFSASLRSEPCFHVTDDRKILTLRAITVDRIADVSAPLVDGTDREALKAWYNAVKEVFNKLSTRSLNVDRKAFWRALIADQTRDEFPAPSAWRDYHRIFEESMASWPLSDERLEYWKQRVDPAYKPGCHNLGAAYPVLGAALSYSTQLQSACQGRSFSTTSAGCMGLVPPKTCAEDLVCIVSGLQTPFILRSHPTEPGVKLLVGECYMHGMMSGEMVTPGPQWKWFKIA